MNIKSEILIYGSDLLFMDSNNIVAKNIIVIVIDCFLAN